MTNAKQVRTAREKAAAMRAEAARAELRRKRLLVALTALGAAVVVVLVTILVLVAKDKENAQSAPPKNLVNGAILQGNANAKVTIDLYEDFQCPVCKEEHLTNESQYDKWVKAGTVKIMIHPIAILDHNSTSSYSSRALNAAAAVENYAPASFLQFRNLLFINQPAEGTAGLTDDQLIQYAVQAGAPEAQIRKAVQGQDFLGWAAKTTDDSGKAGVTSTPTIKIDGVKMKDWSLPVLTAAVTAASTK